MGRHRQHLEEPAEPAWAEVGQGTATAEVPATAAPAMDPEAAADRGADLGARVRAAGAAQRHDGNRRVQRMLSLQRDPPAGGFQLQTPSLLGGRSGPRLGSPGEFQLHLDPEIEAQMRAIALMNQLLDPEVVRTSLVQLGPAALSGAGPAAPNPLAGPAVPAPAPLVPAGAGPSPARAASVGDLIRAIGSVPAVSSAITTLQTRATDQLRADWRNLRTGGQVAVISAGALIGSGVIAGVISSPSARAQALDLLNGRVLPVPGVPGLSLELNTQRGGLMVGAHLDVGRLLPASLGFGPSSPTPIGGPPLPEPSPLGR